MSAKEPAVVIKVVDIDLVSTNEKAVQKAVRHLIAALGNDLKCRFNVKRGIHVHQLRAKPFTLLSLDVVRHHRATGVCIGPEPNKGDVFSRLAAQEQQQHGLQDAVDTKINRPCRELGARRTSVVHPLNSGTNGRRCHGAKNVIGVSR